MTERQKQTLILINDYMEQNPGSSITTAVKMTGTTYETYRAAVNSIIKKRKERRIIRRKGNNGNEPTATA